jgi:hypothetical protein
LIGTATDFFTAAGLQKVIDIGVAQQGQQRVVDGGVLPRVGARLCRHTGRHQAETHHQDG